jgi:Transposase DDE domain
MAIASVLARLRRQPLDDLPIASALDQAAREHQFSWRDRLLPPLVTLRLFLLQVLHGNAAIAQLRQLCGIDFAISSYCEARQRLPLEVLTSLLSSLVQWAGRSLDVAASGAALLGQRVLVVDCSNFSMSDEPCLREHFHLPQGTRPGIGYPLAMVMGLMDLASGMIVQMLCLPLLVHEMRAVASVHAALRSGDILLGDRAFCSFAHLALLNARGVLACFRLHQRRKGQGGHGIQRWERPKQPPAWMTLEQFLALPQWIIVRLVSYTLSQKGYRTKHVTIATTLLDERAWPDASVAELYGQRWRIEGCFNQLKTHMKMNVLKCKTVEGVLKELAVYLLVYNLVRIAMLHAADDQQVSVQRISFIDALRWLGCRMLGLVGAKRLILNPHRPGRWQPRVLRRRVKPYDFLTHPRAELKKAVESEGKC